MGLPPPRASGGLVSGAPGPRPACVPPPPPPPAGMAGGARELPSPSLRRSCPQAAAPSALSRRLPPASLSHNPLDSRLRRPCSRLSAAGAVCVCRAGARPTRSLGQRRATDRSLPFCGVSPTPSSQAPSPLCPSIFPVCQGSLRWPACLCAKKLRQGLSALPSRGVSVSRQPEARLSGRAGDIQCLRGPSHRMGPTL